MTVSGILTDAIVVIHFAWVVSMVAGFLLTIAAFHWRKLFDLFWLRTVHLVGILFVATLGALGKPCPLTLWESSLRAKNDPNAIYVGSFVARWIEKVIYPDVSPLVVTLPAIVMALVTLIVFIIKPPTLARSVGHKFVSRARR